MSQQIAQMFTDIAGYYDLGNDILSLGLHRRWRKQATALFSFAPNANFIDICCGTGDWTLELARMPNTASVVGVDFVPKMLELAGAKSKRSIACDKVRFMEGDALALPFDNESFSGATIGFGIRNVDSISKCLNECHRVLKPHGELVIVELGRPVNRFMLPAYWCYCKWLMPLVGKLLGKNQTAYRYLPTSAWNFPSGDQFLKYMLAVGFSDTYSKKILGGIAYFYYGKKIS